MKFQHAIDAIAASVRVKQTQADEWEKDVDPHALNKPRLEMVQEQIADMQEAIVALQEARAHGAEGRR